MNLSSKYLLNVFLAISLVFTAVSASAQSTDNASIFDTANANSTLSKLNVSHFIEKASIKELQNAINTLTQLETQAKKCIDVDTSELDKVSKQLSAIPPTPGQQPTILTPEQKYLGVKKSELTDELSTCRLFVLRTDEALRTLNDKLRTKVKTELFYAGATVFNNVQKFPSDFSDFYKAYDPSVFAQRSGIYLFNFSELTALILCLLLGLVVAFKLRTLITKAISTTAQEKFIAHFQQAVLSVLHKYLPLLLPAFIFSFFITAISLPSITELPLLAEMSYALIVYLIFMMLVRLYFYPPKPARSFSNLPDFLAKTLVRRLKSLSILVLIGYFIHVIFNEQAVPESLISLLRTFLITLIAINLIAVVWLVKRLPKISYHYGFLRFLISFTLSLLLIAIIVAQWFGYHLLAAYLLYAISMTVFSVFITRLLHKIIIAMLDGMSGSERPWQQKFKNYFGIKPHENLPEILWLKLLLIAVVWGGLLLILLKIWGLAQTAFHLVLNALIHGFQIGHFKLVFLNIAMGIVFFIMLSAATRVLCNHIVKSGDIRLDKGNRKALASIVSYIGFAVALIFGLLIAGVNFSGLAFIAGALSVGIGFGLQNIVSNFISGIILLIERPIKPGDRIIVGDTEGYVRRISIRSTHIVTLQKSDVIVPNSDLISKQVTNYMLYDTNFRIKLNIGLAYGSNIELAKKLLLDIARSNPEVVSERLDQVPMVYFLNFGESTLNFELTCLLKDVDQKGVVISDLNFAINKVFKENNIEIAFPQRDLNIKNWPETTVQLKDENN